MTTTTPRFNPHTTPNASGGSPPPTSAAEVKVSNVLPSVPAAEQTSVRPPGETRGSTLKKVSLGGIAKKKESGKTDYPVLPDPHGKAAEAAAEVRKLTDEAEAIDGALKSHKKFLIELATPFHFTFAAGRAWEKSLGIMVQKDGANLVRLDFKHSYPLLENEAALLPILGERTGAFFHQKFEFKIDGDKLPEAHAGEIVAELQALFAKFNCGDALTVKEGVLPNEDFHLKRHLLLTPEQNVAVQGICPIRAAVATKNIK